MGVHNGAHVCAVTDVGGVLMSTVDKELSITPNYNLDDWVDAGCWDINIHTDHAYLYVTAYEMTTDPKGWSDKVAWQVVKPLPNEGERK